MQDLIAQIAHTITILNSLGYGDPLRLPLETYLRERQAELLTALTTPSTVQTLTTPQKRKSSPRSL